MVQAQLPVELYDQYIRIEEEMKSNKTTKQKLPLPIEK